MSIIATCDGDRILAWLPHAWSVHEALATDRIIGLWPALSREISETPCPQTVNSTTKNSCMKARKSRNLVIMSLVVASVFAGPVFNATALTWTGLSAVTNLWSDTNNWSPTQPLTFDYTAAFGNTGSTNVIGAVNNVVDANYTLTNLTYSAVFN